MRVASGPHPGSHPDAGSLFVEHCRLSDPTLPRWYGITNTGNTPSFTSCVLFTTLLHCQLFCTSNVTGVQSACIVHGRAALIQPSHGGLVVPLKPQRAAPAAGEVTSNGRLTEELIAASSRIQCEPAQRHSDMAPITGPRCGGPLFQTCQTCATRVCKRGQIVQP